jgi:hypothetical protein
MKECVLLRREINNENLVVLGLIEACNMHKIITSDKSELKTLKQELKAIVKESPIAGAVAVTIKQMQAAIAMATIASATAGSR